MKINKEGSGPDFIAEKPFMPKRVFISYGHDEHASLAIRLRDDLKARGHQVWFDEERLNPGHDWEAFIEHGIEDLTADKANSAVVLLLTPHSVRRPDGYCLNEIAFALGRGLRIIPLMVVDSEPPLSICRIQWLDMRPCIPINEKEAFYAPKFSRFLKALEEEQLDFEGAQQRLLKQLQPLEFDVEILSHVPKFTGRQWVFEAIQRWLADSPKQRVFWITGSPGVGKTALSAVLSSRHLEVAALHLCKHGHGQKGEPRNVVKSIVYQLTTQLPDYESRLVNSNMDLERLVRDNARTMFDNLLVQPLAKLKRPEHPIIILIDGLDEATKEGHNELAKFIAEEFPKTPPWLRLIITSRPEKAVTAPLQALDPFVLDTETELNRADIREYLRRELGPFLQNRSDADQLVQEILARSEGVFLYVEQVCADLQEGHLSLDRPDEFPKGLGEVFWRFFRRQFPDDRKFRNEVRPPLRAILAARQPLPIETLKRLFAWEDEGLRDFTRALGSLFPVIKQAAGEVIKPYHKALFDWLADEGKADTYYVSIAEGHFLLSEYGGRTWRQDKYALAHVPAHLLACQRLEDAVALLTDASYLDAKINAGLVFDLADDIATLFKKLPEGDARGRLIAVLETQARSEKAAMVRMTIQCLAAIAEHDPAAVSKVVTAMLDRPLRGRGLAVAKGNMQAARVALEVAVVGCRLVSMAEAVQQVVLAACASPRTNIRSLAMVAVFRIMHNNANYELGLEILQELARRSVWFGFIRPRRLEVFAGCAVGLFFERPDDERLGKDLKHLVGGVVRRIWGLKPAIWLGSKVVAVLWGSVAEDWVPINVAELKAYKKYVAKRPELNEAVNDLIDFLDPGHSTTEHLLQALIRADGMLGPPESYMGFYCTGSPGWSSRAIAGEDSLIESVYELRENLPPDHFSHQDFMFWMRIVQLGRQRTRQPQLSQHWNDRVAALIRTFMREQRGVINGSKQNYMLGGMPAGLSFLAHQIGHGHLPLLEELIEWASTGESGMLRWPQTPQNDAKDSRRWQADALLMRTLEITGVEFGSHNQVSRELAFFGMRCFLKHGSKFDDFLWDRLATTLSRMRFYRPDEVDHFLADLPSENRETLQRRMNDILPKEGVGTLLSNFEMIAALVLAEPAGKKDGLRNTWQEFLRDFLSPKSLSATFRYGIQKLLYLVQTSSSGASNES